MPRTKSDKMIIEMAEEYTGFSALVLRGAVKRGELRAFRPGGSPKSRLYFSQNDLDAWLDGIAVAEEEDAE